MTKTLGVTGGIGSGKTAVCRLFEALGARVFYAAVEAKRLMEQDPEVRAEIEAAFGSESYDAEGRLNRAYLARQVFGHEENASAQGFDGWLNVQHVRSRLYGALPETDAERIRRAARRGTRKLIPKLAFTVVWNL